MKELVLSVVFVRKAAAYFICGIFAAIFMLLECMLLYQMAGIGSATSGSQSGYEALKWV